MRFDTVYSHLHLLRLLPLPEYQNIHVVCLFADCTEVDTRRMWFCATQISLKTLRRGAVSCALKLNPTAARIGKKEPWTSGPHPVSSLQDPALTSDGDGGGGGGAGGDIDINNY